MSGNVPFLQVLGNLNAAIDLAPAAVDDLNERRACGNFALRIALRSSKPFLKWSSLCKWRFFAECVEGRWFSVTVIGEGPNSSPVVRAVENQSGSHRGPIIGSA
jgi:hypothetical protein